MSDEAKRCGEMISGEIGTLPEESPVDEGGNDGEDRHVTPLPKVDDLNDGAPCDGEKKYLLGAR